MRYWFITTDKTSIKCWLSSDAIKRQIKPRLSPTNWQRCERLSPGHWLLSRCQKRSEYSVVRWCSKPIHRLFISHKHIPRHSSKAQRGKWTASPATQHLHELSPKGNSWLPTVSHSSGWEAIWIWWVLRKLAVSRRARGWSTTHKQLSPHYHYHSV